MKFDTRTEMALNLIINMGLTPHESFKTLAMMCARWGMTGEQSLPIAKELNYRLGLNIHQGTDVLRSALQAIKYNPN